MNRKKKLKKKDPEKSKKKDSYNFMLYVPEITHEDWKLEDEKVILYFKVKDPVKRFSGWLIKKTATCDITFDELCTKAWLAIDGKRSVYEICRLMGTQTGETLEQSIYRLIPYMKHIAKKGWIKFKEVKKIDNDKSTNFIREY